MGRRYGQVNESDQLMANIHLRTNNAEELAEYFHEVNHALNLGLTITPKIGDSGKPLLWISTDDESGTTQERYREPDHDYPNFRDYKPEHLRRETLTLRGNRR